MKKRRRKDSSKDSSRKEICFQQECRLVLHEHVDLWHLPSRHEVLRLFSSHLEIFFSGLYVRSAQGMVSSFPWQQPTYPLSTNLLVQQLKFPFSCSAGRCISREQEAGRSGAFSPAPDKHCGCSPGRASPAPEPVHQDPGMEH